MRIEAQHLRIELLDVGVALLGAVERAEETVQGGAAATVSARGMVRPAQDGSAMVQVAFMGKTATVPVTAPSLRLSAFASSIAISRTLPKSRASAVRSAALSPSPNSLLKSFRGSASIGRGVVGVWNKSVLPWPQP